MPKFKWSSPREWLNCKIMLAKDLEILRQIAWTLCAALDPDTIQDLFQGKMVKDGYFEEEA